MECNSNRDNAQTKDHSEIDELEALEVKMRDGTLTADEALRLGRLSLKYTKSGPPTARQFDRSREPLGMFMTVPRSNCSASNDVTKE